MAISNLDDLVAAMGQSYRVIINRTSVSSASTGHEMSLWRGAGFPPQAAIPTAAAICNASTLGAMPLAARSGGQERVIAGASFAMATVGHCLILEDRLGQMGGLNGTLLSAQTVNLDLHANLGVSNLAARIGNANYSEVVWYLEWYGTTGATAATPTAAVTYHDGTTGTVNAWILGTVLLPASVAPARRYRLAPVNGKYIRSVESVTLSVSTGAAGNFGVTALRQHAFFENLGTSIMQVRDWSYLALPVIQDNACLTLGQVTVTTSTGVMTGTLIQAVN